MAFPSVKKDVLVLNKWGYTDTKQTVRKRGVSLSTVKDKSTVISKEFDTPLLYFHLGYFFVKALVYP